MPGEWNMPIRPKDTAQPLPSSKPTTTKTTTKSKTTSRSPTTKTVRFEDKSDQRTPSDSVPFSLRDSTMPAFWFENPPDQPPKRERRKKKTPAVPPAVPDVPMKDMETQEKIDKWYQGLKNERVEALLQATEPRRHIPAAYDPDRDPQEVGEADILREMDKDIKDYYREKRAAAMVHMALSVDIGEPPERGRDGALKPSKRTGSYERLRPERKR